MKNGITCCEDMEKMKVRVKSGLDPFAVPHETARNLMKVKAIELAIKNDCGRVCCKESFKMWVARSIIRYKFRKPNLQYKNLNLGCGQNFYENFLNVDILVNKSLLFKCVDNFLYMDVSSEWVLPDNFFKTIYTEHLLEHLTYTQAVDVLQNCHASLKQGGVLRIIVPSLDNYLKDDEIVQKYSGYLALAISNLTQNAGHVSTWDFKLMKQVLDEIGFKKILKCGYREGMASVLLKDTDVRENYSMYVECVK